MMKIKCNSLSLYTVTNSMSVCCRWIGIRLELLGNILILAASIFALLTQDLSGAEVGLSITYALQVGL